MDFIDQVLEILKNIERGGVSVSYVQPFHGIKTSPKGNSCCKYRTAEGWEIVVFNDAGSFDYIARVIDPFGRVLNIFDDDSEKYLEELRAYKPSPEIIKEVYQLDE